MSHKDEPVKLLPPAEVEVLRLYLESVIRHEASARGQKRKAKTQTQLVEELGLSAGLISNIIKRTPQRGLASKWPAVVVGLGIDIETALRRARDRRDSAEGRREIETAHGPRWLPNAFEVARRRDYPPKLLDAVARLEKWGITLDDSWMRVARRVLELRPELTAELVALAIQFEFVRLAGIADEASSAAIGVSPIRLLAAKTEDEPPPTSDVSRTHATVDRSSSTPPPHVRGVTKRSRPGAK